MVLLSTEGIGAQLFRVEIAPAEGTGLRERCFTMIDKIASFPLSKISSGAVGRLSDADLLRINAAGGFSGHRGCVHALTGVSGGGCVVSGLCILGPGAQCGGVAQHFERSCRNMLEESAV